MPKLECRLVDPRDTTWEVWDPSHRVYFWHQQVRGGWACREYAVMPANGLCEARTILA